MGNPYKVSHDGAADDAIPYPVSSSALIIDSPTAIDIYPELEADVTQCRLQKSSNTLVNDDILAKTFVVFPERVRNMS
jgi:hypothetical protein